MEITVEKIALIREDFNPKNTTLNLDVDWSVEYTDTDQRDIRYNIIGLLRRISDNPPLTRFLLALETVTWIKKFFMTRCV